VTVKILLSMTLLALAACGPKMIPNTNIEDTLETRGVLSVLQAYKHAMETRDADGVLKLCSLKYFEDNGNADPNDDYGYKELHDRVLPETFKRLAELTLELEVREITVDKDKAGANLRFSYRARMALPAGDKWNVDAEVNRIELQKEGNAWKITSGL